MSQNKLLIGFVTAVLFAAGFGGAASPASAAVHLLRVTLVGGSTITVSAEIPDGVDPTTLTSIPGVSGEILSVQDDGPVDTTTTETTPATTTGTTSTATTPTTTSTAPSTTTVPSTTPTTPASTTTAPVVTTPTTTTATPVGAGDTSQKATTRKKKAHAEDESSAGTSTTTTTADLAGSPLIGGAVAADPLSPFLTASTSASIPNVFIDNFRVPPFLLPIYQAAGNQYGIQWQVLAAINEIESDYGRNLSVSTAGAVGWMQFMPATWKTYGVDANGDGVKDPNNPVDAIFAAARYLKAAGGDTNLRQAIFAYNHASWYVDSVLLRAKLLTAIPAALVSGITGLAEGRFPVHAKATFVRDAAARALDKASAKEAEASTSAPLSASGQPTATGLATTYSDDPAIGWYDAMDAGLPPASGIPNTQPGIAVYNQSTLAGWWRVEAPGGASAILQQTDIGPAPSTGALVDINAIAARTIFGVKASDFPSKEGKWKITYLGKQEPAGASQPATGGPLLGDETTSANVAPKSVSIYAKAGAPAIAVQDGTIVALGPDPQGGQRVVLRDVSGNTYTYRGLGSVSGKYPAPADVTAAAGDTRIRVTHDPAPSEPATAGTQTDAATTTAAPATTATAAVSTTRATVATRPRIFAHPARTNAYVHGGAQQLAAATGTTSARAAVDSSTATVFDASTKGMKIKKLKVGSRVVAGTVLGKVGDAPAGEKPHIGFNVIPASTGIPQVNPEPILNTWKLFDETGIYGSATGRALLSTTGAASDAQIFAMTKPELIDRVLNDKRISIYQCGREDIRSGKIDRRVLATLAFLVNHDLDPTVTALECGHSEYTTSGNVSEHSTGDAVDIGAINGIVISPATQGAGTITDTTIRRLLTLQGDMAPHQIISLMQYPGAPNTLALPDHYNHIHVGFHPVASGAAGTAQEDASLAPKQWSRLVGQLGRIDNPKVSSAPSKFSLPAGD